MKMLLLGLIVLFSSCDAFTPPIPLLAKDPGYRLNDQSISAPVRLDAFLDLNCPDSAFSWPILKQLSQEYGSNKLDVVIYMFPLPYHPQAFLCTQGYEQVLDKQADKVNGYIEAIYDNIEKFGSTNTNITQIGAARLISTIQYPATGIDHVEFARDISGYRSELMKKWKYVIKRGPAGTPWFFVNNIDLSINPDTRLSLDDWKNIIDPLFK